MITLPRNAQLWLPGLLRQYAWFRRRPLRGAHVMFAIADHYEPFNGDVSRAHAERRVEQWRVEYPRSVEGLRDAEGRPPQHSFFYPAEQYDPDYLERLGALVERGFGEVEVHLHHDGDTSANLRRTLIEFTTALRERHGLLTRHADGSTAYGFIHGNWALDNARPDGKHCGVDDELTILMETGCYADFTLPAVPDVSQTSTVNSIYYASDDPLHPKSHDRGIRAAVSRRPPADGLLVVQGPLGLDWSRRVHGVFPGVESGTLDHSPAHRPDGARFRRWLAASITVEGRPDWMFVKVHTHGAPERNAAALLGPDMRALHVAMLQEARDREMHLHYVTAREMANIIRAAEAGASGDPSSYRDYWLPPPDRGRRGTHTSRLSSAFATASDRECTWSFS